MDWSDERFIKIYTRDSTNWLALSWQARGLFVLILRKLNRAGAIDLGRMGAKGVAVHVDGSAASWPSIEPYFAELVDDGCVIVEGAVLRVPNFVEAQAAIQSPAARKRAEREREKDRDEVTKRDGPSRNVTASHAESRDVTGGHAPSRDVTTRLEEKRLDERREEPPPAREDRKAAPRPTPAPGTLSGRDAFDALADASRGVADLIGSSYELSLLRMLGAARLTPDEVRAMAEACKTPAAWWPKGTRDGAPDRVTAKRLAAYPSKGNDGGYECGPLSDLIAYVRGEAAKRAASARRRPDVPPQPSAPPAPPKRHPAPGVDFAAILRQPQPPKEPPTP